MTPEAVVQGGLRVPLAHLGCSGNPTSGGELYELIHTRDGELPSDFVSSPVVRGAEHGSYVTYCVVVLALIVADVLACVRAVA